MVSGPKAIGAKELKPGGTVALPERQSDTAASLDVGPSAPTLAEIARAAGVSRMTASRAINDRRGVSAELRSEILRIADNLGYVPNWSARKLSAQRSGAQSGIIGVIAEMHTPFMGELVTAIGRAVRKNGQDMLVYSLPEPGRDMPRNVLDLFLQAVDGVIAVLPRNAAYLSTLWHGRIPIVQVDRREDDVSTPCVTVDNYQGGCLAVHHLIELRHKKIAFISGEERLFSARERLRAYRDVMEQAGLTIEPGYIVDGAFLEAGGERATEQLLALSDSPTAIFAANDLSACGAMKAIQKAGLTIPGDISLVGFDDVPLASQVHPAMTTVRQPLEAMGSAAVDLIQSLRQNLVSNSELVTLPVNLIVRQTTGPCAP